MTDLLLLMGAIVLGCFLLLGCLRVWPVALLAVAVGAILAGSGGAMIATMMAGSLGLMVFGWEHGKV